MLTPTIDIANLTILLSSTLAGFVVIWGIKKSIKLLF